MRALIGGQIVVRTDGRSPKEIIRGIVLNKHRFVDEKLLNFSAKLEMASVAGEETSFVFLDGRQLTDEQRRYGALIGLAVGANYTRPSVAASVQLAASYSQQSLPGRVVALFCSLNVPRANKPSSTLPHFLLVSRDFGVDCLGMIRCQHGNQRPLARHFVFGFAVS